MIDCGERVVALTRQRGHGSASGTVTELEYAQVIKLREGKVVEVDIPQSRTSPRSRRAFGVGDVAGERGGRASGLWRSGQS